MKRTVQLLVGVYMYVLKRRNKKMNQDKVYDKTLYDNLDYERDKIRRIENQVKAKPTEKDLKIAISVLKDFGITATISDIPDVKSVYELEKWKARLIKDRLDREDK